MKTLPDAHLISVRGRIRAVYFAGPQFSAGVLASEEGSEMKFAGRLFARENDNVFFRGRWETHPKFGRQFAVAEMQYDLQPETNGLAEYLANHPELKGVGPVKARRIAETFGKDFDRAITEEPEKVAAAAQVSLEAIQRFRDEWLKTRETNQVMTWLSSFGLTFHQVSGLVEKFGNSTLGLLQADPYLLVKEMPGLGFKRVDRMARQIGTAKEDPARIRAGILHCVNEALDQGDCWVEFVELVEQANLLLVMDVLNSRDRIEEQLGWLLDQNALVCVPTEGRFLIARPEIHWMEECLARRFQEAGLAKPHRVSQDQIQVMLAESLPPLNAAQRQAVLAAFQNGIALVSGAAGTGKTLTISAIARIAARLGWKVLLAAPTGKAAKRLEQLSGHQAVTVHRLLGFNGKKYAKDAGNPVFADMVIVDEISMVDVPLAWQLFQAIDRKRTSVVLVGDHNQLPPVGPGNLLRDLVESRTVPTVILDQMVRQAGTLKENCLAVLRGEVRRSHEPESASRGPWYLADQFADVVDARRFVLQLYSEILDKRLGFQLPADVQLLTPTHKGPLGTRELNVELQRLLQKKLWNVDVPAVEPGHRPKFFIHDRVIQTRNNYELGVMNGTMGTVLVAGRDGSLEVDFEGVPVQISAGSSNLQDIELAYVLTIFKTQGSEFPCAVVVVHKAHSFMHHRNLLYTAVTRARETTILIGDRWGLANCAQKQLQDNRRTFLSILLAPDRPWDCGDISMNEL